MIRLAFIISHPIQYYAPLHQRLAQRDDVEIKVFFTWHDGQHPVLDSGFMKPVSWDIPLTEGYNHELVSNIAGDPGTHHFFGLRNPDLVARVRAWQPNVVHVTGWAWASHLWALRTFSQEGIPTLFRGDSHLLDETNHGLRWLLKKLLLQQVYSWPVAFLYVGQVNLAYYEAFGVAQDRLHYCPHSIDVARFAEPADLYEREAREWRRDLGIADEQTVMLFAGKFEPKKRPIELMQTMVECGSSAPVLIMVGNGALDAEVQALAAAHPTRFRVLPFQNQQRMPVVYRLGDLFVLPSAWGETWGLAVNEALACGRPVLVSDRVGCGVDVVNGTAEGAVPHGSVFRWDDAAELEAAIRRWKVLVIRPEVRESAIRRSRDFDIRCTEETLLDCVRAVMS